MPVNYSSASGYPSTAPIKKRARSSTGSDRTDRWVVIESASTKRALEKGGLHEESDAKKFAVIRQSSFDHATNYVAKKTGCSNVSAAMCVFLTLVLLIGSFAWLAGPEIILTLLRTGDLPDAWPICDGSQAFYFCECAPGFSATGAKWGDLAFGTHCKPCAANERKAGRGNHACSACSMNAASKPGSKSCTVCDAGYIRGAGDLACRQCPRNTFRDSATSAVCRSCGKYAFTNGAAKDQPTDCICLKGAFRNSTKVDAPCVQCPVRTYKNTTGDGECTAVTRKGYKANNARDAEVPLSNSEKVDEMVPYEANDGFFTGVWKAGQRGALLVGITVDDVGAQLVSIGSYLNSAYDDLLKFFYEQFFGGKANFDKEYEASGGTANAKDWEEADEDGKYNKKGADCPFRDASAVTEFCKKSDHYKQLVKAKCKAQAKAFLKQLSLAFHPDKFNNVYRACDDNLSQDAFIHFRSIYDGKSC